MIWYEGRAYPVHDRALGWNPASNSEGGEGFVVREVQGRGGPLNSRPSMVVGKTEKESDPLPITCQGLTQAGIRPRIQREGMVPSLGRFRGRDGL